MASPVARLIKSPLQCRRPRFDFWVRKICWRRDRSPTPVFLGFPCGSAGKESACSAGDLGWEDPWEKGKATHSNILAWRIPWSCKELNMTERLSHNCNHSSTNHYFPPSFLTSGNARFLFFELKNFSSSTVLSNSKSP